MEKLGKIQKIRKNTQENLEKSCEKFGVRTFFHLYFSRFYYFLVENLGKILKIQKNTPKKSEKYSSRKIENSEK